VRTAPPAAAAPAEQATEASLNRHRPDLTDRYARELPAARASVLARLWGGYAREPVPGVAARRRDGGDLVILLHDGRQLRGPADAAAPFAIPAGLTLSLDGTRYDRPGALLSALHPSGPATRLPADAVASGAMGSGGMGSGAAEFRAAAARFAAELDNSVANLALARAAGCAEPAGDSLADLEQSILDGHPLHPCCRTRTGLSTADVLAYAPEHRRVVQLVLVAVPPARWLSTGSGLPPVLPVHPWQWRRVRQEYPWLEPTGHTMPARPLMSLRTLDVGAHHLKTAVDAQMTSAVRTVSAAALHNGPAVSTLLAGLARDVPGLAVLAETAAGAALVDGAPCRRLAVVRRDAPGVLPGERVLPLAALGVPALFDLARAGRPPVAFFAELARVLLVPLTRLLHLGIALEAHGQNTLLAVRDGRPVRLLYRDMGGVRISPARLARAGLSAPPLAGDVVNDDPDELRTKLFAAAVSTVLAEVAELLVREHGAGREGLWGVVATAGRAAYAGSPGAAAGDRAALFGATLPIKAMTAMRLSAEPVRDIWARLPNPLAGAA
jgi:siderophore synthetase component